MKSSSILDALQRDQPHDAECEMALLGSIMLRPEAFAELSTLRASDFYADANKIIFRAITEILIDGNPLDIRVLVANLNASGHYETSSNIDERT